MFVYFPSGRSFTGEELVEIHTHGGEWIVRSTIEAACELGAEIALPGEFSFRAVKNGKLSLAEAEAISDLIKSGSQASLDLALEKLSGSQGKYFRHIADRLRDLLTFSEVGIDFSDQDVGDFDQRELQKKARLVAQDLQSVAKTFERGIRVQSGISVVLIGPPNVGKSSLFNALLGEDRAIVSETPGTTRDTLREKLTIAFEGLSHEFRLEDVAGLRATSDVIERAGIERGKKAAQAADLVLVLVNMASYEAAQFNEVTGLKLNPEKVLGVMTQVDRLPDPLDRHTRMERARSELAVSEWILTSAVSGEGISELAESLVLRAEKMTHRKEGEILLTRMEHRDALLRAIGHLERAQAAGGLDLFASDLRHALHELAPLIGETLPDDILGKIFSEFCIGK